MIFALVVCNCAHGTSRPSIPVEPVIDGETVKIHLELVHASEGAATKEYLGGLIKNAIRIDKATIVLYQYNGCNKVERGRVALLPTRPAETVLLRSGGYLFADVYFQCSKGTSRVDYVTHLQQDTEYSLKAIYDEQSPSIFRTIIYRHIYKNGELRLEPVDRLSYREGIKKVLLTCREQ